MLADATALLRVIAAPDLPEGFVAIDTRLGPGVLGASAGAGFRTAEAVGERFGRPAVLIDLDKFATLPADFAPVVIAETVIHEAAHMLLAEETLSVEDIAAAIRARQPAGLKSALAVAREQCPRWAAALWLLTSLAMRYRPRARTDFLHCL